MTTEDRVIQLHRDLAANWTAANVTLADGEIGLEKDTPRFVFGDGATPWNSLTKFFYADAVRYGAQVLTSPQMTQFLNNTKTMPTLRPEQFGAVADGVTDDSVAFYKCIKAGKAQPGGCYIQLQQGVKYYVSTAGQAYALANDGVTMQGLIDLYTGVYIGVPGGSGRAATGATYIVGDHTFTGYIIDTNSLGAQGCGINGILVTSDMSSGISTPCRGVRFFGVEWGHMFNAGVGNVSDVGLSLYGSVDCHIENVGLSHNVTGRTLTDVTPTMFVNGTDHVFINIQANGGNNNATIGQLSAGTNFYNPAIQLWGALTCKFWGVNGEFSDVGWYLGGTSSVTGGVASTFVSINQFTDVRGDYNAAHGFYINGAAWNQFHSTTVYNNSNNSNGTYDGVYIANVVTNVGNRFTTVMGASPTASSLVCTLSGTTLTATSGSFNANMVNKMATGIGITPGTTITYTSPTTATASTAMTSGTGITVQVGPQIMGYYYHDAITGGITQLDANLVSTIGGARQGMAYDYGLTNGPYRYSLMKNGLGSYIYRPASRYMGGATWVDYFVPTAPVLTFSDGSGAITGTGGSLIGSGGWKLQSTGAISGNLLNALTVECLGGLSTGWLGITFTGASTVSTATCTFSAVCFNTIPLLPSKLGNNQILQVVCNSAGNTAGYMEVLTPAVTTGIAASTSYAACVQTVALTNARNVKFIIDCYSGTALLSSITTDAGANNSTTAVSTHNFTFTTPVSTNAIQVRIRFTSVVTGEVHYVGLMSIDTHSTQTIPVYA